MTAPKFSAVVFGALVLLATSCGLAADEDSNAVLQSRASLPMVSEQTKSASETAIETAIETEEEAVADGQGAQGQVDRVDQVADGQTTDEQVVGGPPLVFGRVITAQELVEMMAEDGGREQIVDAMVAATTATEEEAGCMLSNLPYETFAAVANAEQLTQLQLNELLSALDFCGLPTS